jgi:hypothetical protein
MKLVFALVVFLAGCSVKQFPVKNQYLAGPYQTTSSSSKDETWEKIIDFFSQKGLPIKLIDKSSGLIVSEASNLPVTVEGNQGNLSDPNAWVVVPAVNDKFKKKLIIAPYHGNVTGEWNIRIKSTDENKTLINVNLVNLKYKVREPMANYERFIDATTAKSTGSFEKLVADYVK